MTTSRNDQSLAEIGLALYHYYSMIVEQTGCGCNPASPRKSLQELKPLLT